MKLLSFLLKPMVKSKKAGLIIGSGSLLLFAAAAVYLSLFFDIMLPAVIAVLAGLGAMFYKTRLYMMFVELPPIWLIVSLLVSSYTGVYFYGFVDSSQSEKLISSVSCGIAVFFLLVIALSFLLRLISDDAHPKNFLKGLAAVLPLLFTVFVYLPCETYFNNQQEFVYIFGDFALYVFLKTAVFSAVAAIALCSLREKVFRAVSMLSAGLTFCVYCQYVFMNGDIPKTLGEPMDWDSLGNKSIVNAVIWVCLLMLPFIMAFAVSRIKPIKDNAAARNIHLVLTSFIGGIQLISLIALIFSAQVSLFRHESYVLNNREQFVVSKNKNIITFIVDNADVSIFRDVQEKYPEKFEFLNDFTYYSNACMMYDSTQISIPELLSGTTKLPEYKLSDWLEETWSSEPCESFYSRLHDSNYKVNVFGEFALSYHAFREKFDNCTYLNEEDITVDKKLLFDRINKLAALRYMPLGLKRDHYQGNYSPSDAVHIPNSCIFKNPEFYDSLDLKTSESDQNYFIVEHIEGTHLYAGKTEPNALLSLDILDKYFTQLKEMGLYDDAVIIVTGDHGAHKHPDDMPIWYIKTANAHGDEIKTNTAPIHHSDYLATVIEAAGLKQEGDNELFGRSIFEIGEDEKRERLVFQRGNFKYTGDISWQRLSDSNHEAAILGYYFTGDVSDLVERESSGPPDIVIELDAVH